MRNSVIAFIFGSLLTFTVIFEYSNYVRLSNTENTIKQIVEFINKNAKVTPESEVKKEKGK